MKYRSVALVGVLLGGASAWAGGGGGCEFTPIQMIAWWTPFKCSDQGETQTFKVGPGKRYLERYRCADGERSFDYERVYTYDEEEADPCDIEISGRIFASGVTSPDQGCGDHNPLAYLLKELRDRKESPFQCETRGSRTVCHQPKQYNGWYDDFMIFQSQSQEVGCLMNVLMPRDIFKVGDRYLGQHPEDAWKIPL